MTPIQYDQLCTHPLEAPPGTPIRGRDLSDKSPRTLLWGYTSSHHSFHAYLDEQGAIHRVIYVHTGKHVVLVEHSHEEQTGEGSGYLSAKRLYPEACDYEFCAYLVDHGIKLPFSPYNDETKPQQAFRGERLESLSRRR
jgi:hypothetical protein